jgi:uncharacterized delta-60 repeat protein
MFIDMKCQGANEGRKVACFTPSLRSVRRMVGQEYRIHPRNAASLDSVGQASPNHMSKLKKPPGSPGPSVAANKGKTNEKKAVNRKAAVKLWKRTEALRPMSGVVRKFNITKVRGEPPNIISEPRNQQVILYEPAGFGVIAKGSAPLSYQWFKDGQRLAGATNDQFVINASFPDAGLYAVQVANAEGNVISSPARLNVAALSGGELDYSFDRVDLVDGVVTSAAVQPDGKILIAGQFTSVLGATRGNIARLNSDGTLDHTFLGLDGTDNSIDSVALQPDGKILVGGEFRMINGVGQAALARLNQDGTLDRSFQDGLAGRATAIYEVAVQNSGKVVVAGEFPAGNVLLHTVAQFNPDGTPDASFRTPNFVDSEFALVDAVAVQGDGKVLVGGRFTTVDGVARYDIARLNADGTLDNTFQNGMSGVPDDPFVHGINSVEAMTLLADGRVLIAGVFSLVNDQLRWGMARLNPDGSLDPGFTADPNRLTRDVRQIVVQPDGKLLAGTERLLPDGTLDTSFHFGTDRGTILALQDDGKLIIGSATLTDSKRLVRLNSDGTLDRGFLAKQSSLTYPTLPVVRAIALQSDGKVLAGGAFTPVGRGVGANLTRWNPDGTLDTTFQGGLSGPNVPVSLLAVQSDGKVLLGGDFSAVDGISRNSLARLNPDGTLDTGFQDPLRGQYTTALGSLVEVVGAHVGAMALQADGKLLVGGTFSTVQNHTVVLAVRLNIDGTVDPSFHHPGGKNIPCTYCSPYPGTTSIALQSDGKILLAGTFTEIDGVSSLALARLNPDGSVDSNFRRGLPGTTGIETVAVQSDDRILLGGYFTEFDGTFRSGIARLNADGTLDTGFQNGVSGVNGGPVEAIAQQSDGKVLIGGSFVTVNGVPRNRIARLNPDGSLDTEFGNELPGANTTVWALALDGEDKVLMGGNFSRVNDAPLQLLARLWLKPIRRPLIAGSRYAEAVLAKTPIAYWRLNETIDPSSDSVTAADLAQGGHDGTYGSAARNGFNGIEGPRPPSFAEFEAGNTALRTANGVTGSFVTVPLGKLDGNAITFTAWVRPTGVQADWSGLLYSRGGPTEGGFGLGGGETSMPTRAKPNTSLPSTPCLTPLTSSRQIGGSGEMPSATTALSTEPSTRWPCSTMP